MPNYCDYEFKIEGKKKNVKTFLEWMQAEYNYVDGKSECYLLKDNNKIPVKYHIGYRVFECNCEDFEKNYSTYDNNDTINCYCSGYVAWSLYSTMFVGEHTYLGDFNTLRHSHPFGWFKKEKSLIEKIKAIFSQFKTIVQRRNAISLAKACKLLKLKVEAYSRETGCCFAEHYYIDKGKVIEDESVEYTEDWVDDYETYEEYVKDNDNPVSKEIYEYWTEYEGEPYIPRCEWLDPKSYEFSFNYL